MLKTPVAPGVLVVADQRTLGVGGQRRLAGARKPEEDGDVAVLADVRRAVHREDALERQPVVHHREDRLLDLARVVRAADEQLRASRMKDDKCARARAVLRRIRFEVGGVQYDCLRRKARLLLGPQVDEHRPRKQSVIRMRGDDAHSESVRRVGPGPRVDDIEHVGGGEVRSDLVAQSFVVILRELLVDVAPPDAVRRGPLVD